MKKTIKKRKLPVNSEIVRVLRPLSLAELRDARVVGGSEPNCGGCSSCPESTDH